VNRNGFHFTFEAAITLLFVLSFIALLHFPQPYNMDSLLLKQKQHDLLSVWLISRNFNIEEMEKDFLFVFPGTGGFIEINGKRREIGNESTEISIENATYLDEGMELRTVSIGVYR
jgi:hypothetical protein